MLDGRILVTGGAGFIGSHLVEALLGKGYKVRVLDNLSTGKVGNLPVGNANLNLVVGDVADDAAVEQAMRDCTAVVHLAAVASVQASVDDPVSTHQSNFVGTLNVCEHMMKAGIKRVVFASSAAIYGNNGEGSAIDEDTPKSPLTPYASDKLASEYYLDFYRREHGLEPVVLRFFNIFGVFSITYLTNTIKIARTEALMGVMASAVVMCFCIPFFGRLSDRIGRSKVFFWGALITGVSSIPAFWIMLHHADNPLLLWCSVIIPLGVLYSAVYGPEAALFCDLFDAKVRYTGISFVYQFSGIFASGLTPIIATYLLKTGNGEPWHIVGYILFASLVSAVSVAMISNASSKRANVR